MGQYHSNKCCLNPCHQEVHIAAPNLGTYCMFPLKIQVCTFHWCCLGWHIDRLGQHSQTFVNILNHLYHQPQRKKRKYSSAYSNHVCYILSMKLTLPGVLIVGWSSSSPGSAEALPWWPRTRSNRTIANVDSELVSIPCMLSTYQKWLWYLKNQTAVSSRSCNTLCMECSSHFLRNGCDG